MSDVLAGPPLGLVVGSGMLALVLSVTVWPVVLVLMTMVHEGGHAVAGSLMGGVVKSITIESNGNGLTVVGGLGPFGAFLMLFGGYAGPPLFGLLGTMLLAGGRVSVVLWLSLVFLVLALLSTNNWFGAGLIVAVGAVVVLVIRYATTGEQAFFTYTWVWLLLFGGFGQVLATQALRRKGGPAPDLTNLRKMTYVPASLWSGFYWLLCVVVLVVGGGILLGILAPDPRSWFHHG